MAANCRWLGREDDEEEEEEEEEEEKSSKPTIRKGKAEKLAPDTKATKRSK